DQRLDRSTRFRYPEDPAPTVEPATPRHAWSDERQLRARVLVAAVFSHFSACGRNPARTSLDDREWAPTPGIGHHRTLEPTQPTIAEAQRARALAPGGQHRGLAAIVGDP